MNTATFLGGLFLLYLFLLLPRAAFRSARVLKTARSADDSAGRSLSRTRILSSTIFSLAILFLITWATARARDIEIFRLPEVAPAMIVWGIVALGFLLGVRTLFDLVRSEDEKRNLAIHAWMPVTRKEWGLFALSAVGAGIVEEAAYRGMAVLILAPLVGHVWIAAALSAGAFTLVHVAQGWKTMIVIFIIAISMQALVWVTGTLIVAMAVHTVYDLIAGLIVTRRRRRYGLVPG